MHKFIYVFILFIILLFFYFFFFIYAQYRELDKVAFQNFIQDKIIQSEDDLVQAYFLYKEYDFTIYDGLTPKEYVLNIEEEEGDNLHIYFSYLLRDDSIAKNKILISTNESFEQIYYIGRTWKCHKGRGHTYWSSQKCY